MALTPLKLADVQIGTALVENWGRATAYFQRWLNGNNANIQASINGLAAVVAELEAVVAELDATVQQLETLYLYTDTTLRNYINNTLRNNARGFGVYTAATSTGPAGYINIPHGKTYPPDTGFCSAQIYGVDPYCVNIVSADSTYIVVYVFDAATGAAVSGVTVSIAWNAWFWVAQPLLPQT